MTIADSLEKDSLRFLYAKKMQNLIKTTFPKIEMTNDSILLRKNYEFIGKNTGSFILNKKYNKSIEKLSTKTQKSKKQLFITVTSFLGKIRFPNRVIIYILDVQKNMPLYIDSYQYDCDIRDYETLEKVISNGFLKLKENFE